MLNSSNNYAVQFNGKKSMDNTCGMGLELVKGISYRTQFDMIDQVLSEI